MTPTHALLAAAALTWVMVLTASMLRSGGKLPAMLGNREGPGRDDALAGRADRAAKNMLENLVLFVAVILAASLGRPSRDTVELGGLVFVIARVVYFPVYLIGVPGLRTAVWSVGVVGVGMIGASAL
ncbi:MAG: MAPEG family protein [Kofleriaceae bacterium]|nr:MAPEG family protein [Myxococcales bacterium]MCB9560859.1 MAPEG family protein [Kofleriaceae bacterium]